MHLEIRATSFRGSCQFERRAKDIEDSYFFSLLRIVAAITPASNAAIDYTDMLYFFFNLDQGARFLFFFFLLLILDYVVRGIALVNLYFNGSNATVYDVFGSLRCRRIDSRSM